MISRPLSMHKLFFVWQEALKMQVAPVAAKILPGGAGRASSAPLTAAAPQPEANSGAPANHVQQSNVQHSNPMVLPPLPPVRTPHGLASPLGQSVVPPAAHEGKVTTLQHVGICSFSQSANVS